MSDEEATLRRYARAIEQQWSELADRAIVLSPRDFRLLSDWCERGVPLAVVRDALTDACARRRDGAAPRRLSAIAPLVEESWQTVAAGRLGGSPETGSAEQASAGAADVWRERARSSATPGAVRECLARLLADLDAGLPAAEVDARLDLALVDLLPEAVEREIVAATEQRLSPYRDRLDGDAFDAARSRMLLAGRRRALGIPRLGGSDG